MQPRSEAAETEINELPLGWRRGLLGEVVHKPDYGVTASATDEQVGPKFLRITDIQDGSVDWAKVPYCDLPPGEERKRLSDGDIVVARIGATTGKAFLVGACPPAVFASYLIRLRAVRERICPRFLSHYLSSEEYWRHIDLHKDHRLKGGVNIPVLLSLPLLLPPMDEQVAIADSLDAVWSAIRIESDALRVSSALKRTAMRELFTRGLRGEAPKETEIGPIPESWDVRNVSSFATVKGGKRMPKGVALVRENTGKPYIRVTDFKDHGVAAERMLFVPKGFEREIARYTISTDDVYISIAGTIGLVGQVPSALDGANLTENAAKLCAFSPEVMARFAMYALAAPSAQVQIAQATAKNAQPKLALTRIDQIRIPLPQTVDEQREIVTILDAIDRKVALHKEKRAVLEALFKSLLHKLMTGEVRVADLDLDALGSAAEAA